MKVSVIVPAHNEEAFLPKCLDAIDAAVAQTQHEVETIVVLNRCTDGTEAIARTRATQVVYEDAKNLSIIRNAGAAAATGEILITIDSDSYMHPQTFDTVVNKLDSGRYIGGGTLVKMERLSLGIILSVVSVMPYLLWHGVSFGMFWCRKADFDAVGGFNLEFISIEDLDFAKRLKAYGKTKKQRFGMILAAPIVTSCRKFDQFGDWYFFRNPKFVHTLFRGHDRPAADAFWYEARSKAASAEVK